MWASFQCTPVLVWNSTDLRAVLIRVSRSTEFFDYVVCVYIGYCEPQLHCPAHLTWLVSFITRRPVNQRSQLLQTKSVLVFHTHRVRQPFCFWAVLMTHVASRTQQIEAARLARDGFRPACSPIPAAQSLSFALSSLLLIKPDALFPFSLNHYPTHVTPLPHRHHPQQQFRNFI